MLPSTAEPNRARGVVIGGAGAQPVAPPAASSISTLASVFRSES